MNCTVIDFEIIKICLKWQSSNEIFKFNRILHRCGFYEFGVILCVHTFCIRALDDIVAFRMHCTPVVSRMRMSKTGKSVIKRLNACQVKGISLKLFWNALITHSDCVQWKLMNSCEWAGDTNHLTNWYFILIKNRIVVAVLCTAISHFV